MTWTEKTFASLTLEQKVGQVICYRATKWAGDTLQLAREGLVGAVSPLYYDGMRDLDACIGFMNDLQEASPVPVLFLSGWAHEKPAWGGTPFPGANSAMLLAATRDASLARRFGAMAAIESKAVGFDCVWEPCVDVNTNPRNPIIGTRAFSDQPGLVTEMAIAVVQGMQEQRCLPNAKHFPGHGDTDFDTHVKIGVVNHDRSRLDAVELAPYPPLVQAGLRGVMTAHIVFPALDPTPGLPATFSRAAIHGLLRGQMGFQGLIVSDSLTMKAIKDNFGVAEALIRSFTAGHDILLQDYNEPPRPSYDALLDAVRSGAVPMAELDASVRRVLAAKEWVGLHQRGPITREQIGAAFRRPEHMGLAETLYDASVTLLERHGQPLAAGQGKTCVIATANEEDNQALTDFAMTVQSSRDVLFAECQRHLGGIATHVIPEDPSPQDIAAALEAAEGSQNVVFATMPRIVCYKRLSGTAGAGQFDLARQILARGHRLALCVFGTPYVLRDFPQAHDCLTTYCSNAAAVRAGLRVLFGQRPARGRLPITLSSRYPFGFGL